MLKKSIYVGASLMLLLTFCFGHNALSYVKTSANKVSETVKSSVPIDYEIDHARQMIKDLAPEIRRNMHLIAKEEVQVAHVEQRVDDMQKKLSKDRDEIFHLKEALDKGGNVCLLVGRRYTADQVKTDLSNRFKRYRTTEETSFNLAKILDARQQGLDAARQKLNGMLSAKRQLEVDVENLEARMKMVEVAQTTSEFNFDDSHLARTKELILDIQTRIEVSEQLMNSETNFHDQIPLELSDTVEDISEQVTAYFTKDSTEDEVADRGDLDALVAEYSLN